MSLFKFIELKKGLSTETMTTNFKILHQTQILLMLKIKTAGRDLVSHTFVFCLHARVWLLYLFRGRRNKGNHCGTTTDKQTQSSNKISLHHSRSIISMTSKIVEIDKRPLAISWLAAVSLPRRRSLACHAWQAYERLHRRLWIIKISLAGSLISGADLGGGCRGCAPLPPPEMKPSSFYSLLRFVYLTG